MVHPPLRATRWIRGFSNPTGGRYRRGRCPIAPATARVARAKSSSSQRIDGTLEAREWS